MSEAHALQAAPAKPEPLERLETVLRTILRAGGFALEVNISAVPEAASRDEETEWLVNFSGPDSDLVLEGHAALLDAFAAVGSKAARIDEGLARRISFDCEGYRSARASELRLMAEMAAERVRETRRPFALSPMNPAERRLIHLALRDAPAVRTESEGAGPQRKVVIHPAP